MSSSDYIAVKKRRSISVDLLAHNTQHRHLINKQYLTIQTTYEINEDQELIEPTRFDIILPDIDLAYCVNPQPCRR